MRVNCFIFSFYTSNASYLNLNLIDDYLFVKNCCV